MYKLHEYQNGNYTVRIYSDGTKVRETKDNYFIPYFPESIDVNISNRCNKGCKYCYLGCTKDGKKADLSKYEFLFDGLPKGVELALNGNEVNAELFQFLRKLKQKSIIANLTVHSVEFQNNVETLLKWSEEKYIHGLGISMDTACPSVLSNIKRFPNAVIHTVAGIMKPREYVKLAGMKVLILGYKNVGRGVEYYNHRNKTVSRNIQWLRENLIPLRSLFRVLSFDNLAIKQLDVEKAFKEEWDERYMGDDGQYTFYLDLVDGKYYTSSTESHTAGFPIKDSIPFMFNHIRNINA